MKKETKLTEEQSYELCLDKGNKKNDKIYIIRNGKKIYGRVFYIGNCKITQFVEVKNLKAQKLEDIKNEF